MSEFYIGQIMMAGYAFAPKYFAQCNGQLLPIAQNQALFSLLGTQYGGNGTTTFALPDLRSRTPVDYGTSVDPGWQPPPMQIGQTGGVENVTLLPTQLPAHGHTLGGTSATGNTKNPTGGLFGSNSVALFGSANGAAVPLNPATCGASGNSQAHPNLQPYEVINFCIALQGIFPSRN